MSEEKAGGRVSRLWRRVRRWVEDRTAGLFGG